MQFKSPSKTIQAGSIAIGKLIQSDQPALANWHTDLIRGCVTPKQIENLIETCGGDLDMVDGYDELPAEFQEKVRYALEHGHVSDEDWKGVSIKGATEFLPSTPPWLSSQFYCPLLYPIQRLRISSLAKPQFETNDIRTQN